MGAWEEQTWTKEIVNQEYLTYNNHADVEGEKEAARKQPKSLSIDTKYI